MSTTQNDSNVTEITTAKGTGRKRSPSRASKSAARNAAKPNPEPQAQGETLTDDERAQLKAHTDELKASSPTRGQHCGSVESHDAHDFEQGDETLACPGYAEQAPEPEITDALTVLLINGEFEVHKTGCRDIARARKAGKIQNIFGLGGEWSDPRAIAAELWSDQIAEAGIVFTGDDAADAALDLSSYEAETNVRPCTGLTGRAARKSETTRVLDADAAKARAELLDARTKAAAEGGDKLAIPAGYVLHWSYPAGHSRLARTDDAPEGAAKWLARCDEHGTTKPADSAKAARALGSRSTRVEWCRQCKSDAAKKAKADDKAKADKAAAAAAKSSTSKSDDAPASASASDDGASKIDGSDEHDAAVKSGGES